MRIPAGWELFRIFTDIGSAKLMSDWLVREGVPTTVVPRALENARETEFCVLVENRLAHRARWIVSQLPPTDDELDFLATGRLPGNDNQ
ncbi:hypothetical protein DSM104440_00332 [Usitatibacter palustris]|uniref:DUF2007 domain-containing protein n=2 Tax=Usitatibacter palustris TaxID=2732487 RepID=A0A6M4H389_9PROT|nr:hypothetical protein DSM104440_00332 [Usitatibacter palustris]